MRTKQLPNADRLLVFLSVSRSLLTRVYLDVIWIFILCWVYWSFCSIIELLNFFSCDWIVPQHKTEEFEDIKFRKNTNFIISLWAFRVFYVSFRIDKYVTEIQFIEEEHETVYLIWTKKFYLFGTRIHTQHHQQINIYYLQIAWNFCRRWLSFVRYFFLEIFPLFCCFDETEANGRIEKQNFRFFSSVFVFSLISCRVNWRRFAIEKRKFFKRN